MKARLLFMTLAVVALVGSQPPHSFGQQTPGVANEQATRTQAKADTADSITEHEHKKYDAFVKTLALTPEQQPKVKAVLDNRLSEELAILTETPAKKAARMKAINAESQGKMRAILNDEQRAKYDKALKDEADRIAARKKKAKGESGPAPNPPQPAAPPNLLLEAA